MPGLVDDEGDEEYGERKPKRKVDPKEPTQREREEHEVTFMPYRNWCRQCVRGRGKEEACRKVEK